MPRAASRCISTVSSPTRPEPFARVRESNRCVPGREHSVAPFDLELELGGECGIGVLHR